MESIFEIRINDYQHRVAVVNALAAAGYGVVIKERYRKDSWVCSMDCFVCIIYVPELAKYKEGEYDR